MADYMSSKASVPILLPLKNCNYGSILQVHHNFQVLLLSFIITASLIGVSCLLGVKRQLETELHVFVYRVITEVNSCFCVTRRTYRS